MKLFIKEIKGNELFYHKSMERFIGKTELDLIECNPYNGLQVKLLEDTGLGIKSLPYSMVDKSRYELKNAILDTKNMTSDGELQEEVVLITEFPYDYGAEEFDKLGILEITITKEDGEKSEVIYAIPNNRYEVI